MQFAGDAMLLERRGGQEHSHVGFDTLLDSTFAHMMPSDEKGPMHTCLTRHRSNLPGLGADWVEDSVQPLALNYKPT